MGFTVYGFWVCVFRVCWGLWFGGYSFLRVQAQNRNQPLKRLTYYVIYGCLGSGGFRVQGLFSLRVEGLGRELSNKSIDPPDVEHIGVI